MAKKAASPKSKKTATAESSSAAAGFQSFERATTKRSALAFPENNPRSIDKSAFKELKAGLKRHGLLNALVVNRRRESNGFDPSEEGRLIVVGGNQRAHAMDDLAGFPDKPNSDYSVPIDLIEVSSGREKETIVILNNLALQGQWNLDALAELLSAPEVEVDKVGFDRTSLAMMFDQGVLESWGLSDPATSAQAAAEAPIVDVLELYNEAGREAARDKRAAEKAVDAPPTSDRHLADTAGENGPEGDGEPPTEAPTTTDKPDPNSREAMIARRKAYQEKSAANNEAAFMLVLVGQSDTEIGALLHKLELPNTGFVPLAEFIDRIGDYLQQYELKELLPQEV